MCLIGQVYIFNREMNELNEDLNWLKADLLTQYHTSVVANVRVKRIVDKIDRYFSVKNELFLKEVLLDIDEMVEEPKKCGVKFVDVLVSISETLKRMSHYLERQEEDYSLDL